MSYSSKELSVQDSSPVTLVMFSQGETTWRYTTISETISRSSALWDPAPIELGKISSTGDVPKDSLTIKLPITNSVAGTFLDYSPDVVTSVTVFRTHYDDTEVLTTWKGRVASATVDGNIMTLTCEPLFSSLKRLGLRPVYSRSCTRVFGGRGCNVNLTAITHTETATAASGTVVTVPGASGLTNLTYGTLSYGGVSRTIVAHGGGTSITLLQPFKALAAAIAGTPGGVDVDIIEGCDRSPKMCRDTYNNLGNFGGFPGIPMTNPMNNRMSTVT